MLDVLWSLWFFLPAGLANVAPIIASKLPGLSKYDTPMDFGRSYRGKRVLGDHKTWRGILSGIAIGGLVGYIQYLIANNYSVNFLDESPFNYASSQAVLLGVLLGLGALLGDALKSFFKRQIGVKSGYSWFPFDQLDYIVGGCLFAATIVVLDISQYSLIFVIWFSLHLISSYCGYLMKLKDKPI